MKKISICFIAIILIVAMLAGCGAQTNTPAPEASLGSVDAATSTDTPSEAAPEAAPETPEEGEASSYYIDVVYAEQIGRYRTALSEKWQEGKYYENEMSALPIYYYEGNPLENAGFCFIDLDNDGNLELVIGAILNSEVDPAIFEIWTLADGEPTMLVQGGHRNRYVLQHVVEDGMWYIANEAANGAASHATYYLMLSEGKLEVTQGILFDAFYNEANPWFMTHDLDWDASNDEPIDEDTANAIMESHRRHYTAVDFLPFASY